MFKRKPRLITVSDNLGHIAGFDPRHVDSVNCWRDPTDWRGSRPGSPPRWGIMISLHGGSRTISFGGYETEHEARTIVLDVTEAVNKCRSRK